MQSGGQMKTKTESCPKCNGANITHVGNWTGVMVSDIYAEYYWLCKCNSCGFTFKGRNNFNKQSPIDDKRNHA